MSIGVRLGQFLMTGIPQIMQQVQEQKRLEGLDQEARAERLAAQQFREQQLALQREELAENKKTRDYTQARSFLENLEGPTQIDPTYAEQLRSMPGLGSFVRDQQQVEFSPKDPNQPWMGSTQANVKTGNVEAVPFTTAAQRLAQNKTDAMISQALATLGHKQAVLDATVDKNKQYGEYLSDRIDLGRAGLGAQADALKARQEALAAQQRLAEMAAELAQSRLGAETFFNAQRAAQQEAAALFKPPQFETPTQAAERQAKFKDFITKRTLELLGGGAPSNAVEFSKNAFRPTRTGVPSGVPGPSPAPDPAAQADPLGILR